MKFAEKFKNYFTLDDEEENIDDTFEQDEPETVRSSSRPERQYTARGEKPNVVNIHATAKLQVVFKKPESYKKDAADIVNELIAKHTVVVNMKDVNKGDNTNILCFMSGAAFALGGNVKKIAEDTYLVTPFSVDVVGDFLDEIENNGMLFD